MGFLKCLCKLNELVVIKNTFVVFVRRSRKSKWKQTEMTVTSFSPDVARIIAASKNKDKWVKVQIKGR